MTCDASPAATVDEIVARVLIVEEDGSTGQIVARILEAAGHEVQLASSYAQAIQRVEQLWPDCVIVDNRFAGADGRPLLIWLVAHTAAPILVISPAADGQERLRGLGLGADDFVPTPISPGELVARVRSVLRRVPPAAHATAEHLVRAGPVVLDTETRQVRILGIWVVLTPLEFALFHFLVRRAGETLTKVALFEQVWGYTVGDTSTVTVHIRRLREKVEPDPARPILIVTVWGAGYRFDPTAGRGRALHKSTNTRTTSSRSNPGLPRPL